MRGAPASGRLLFRARRNGSDLGEHEIRFTRQGEKTFADIAVDYIVKFGFVTVFRFKLRAREIWLGGKLQAARAKTDNNGKPEFMNLERVGDAHIVEGSKTGRFRAPESHLVASHWNIAQLAAPMINPQDGGLLKYSVAARGQSKVADVNGKSLPGPFCARRRQSAGIMVTMPTTCGSASAPACPTVRP